VADDATLAAQLRRLLTATMGDDIEVCDLRRLGGGSSRENWAFDALIGRHPAQRQELLLRRDPPASVADTDRVIELGLLRALAPTAIPAPIVVADDVSGALLDRPSLVMERAGGRASRSVLRERDPLGLGVERRRDLAVEITDLLAVVHSVDPAASGLAEVLGTPPDDPATAEVSRWLTQLEAERLEPLPELVYLATWLSEHRPAPPARCTLVHGDFRPANILIVNGRIGTLLDWEFAHLGDPAEDLGWYTTPYYRNEHFGERGNWTPPEMLARYLDRAGIDGLDDQRLHFWQVFALFKLGVISIVAVHSFVTGGSDRAAVKPDRFLRDAVLATENR
jgi:aminoglycoside phosphotransferase (APT) family kinase protein